MMLWKLSKVVGRKLMISSFRRVTRGVQLEDGSGHLFVGSIFLYDRRIGRTGISSGLSGLCLWDVTVLTD